MNFVCDKCKQKYHVADEKIRGRAVTRFRCKKCENVIELRSDALPDPDAPDAPKQADAPDSRPRPATIAPSSPRPAVTPLGPSASPSSGALPRTGAPGGAGSGRTRAPTSVGVAFNAGMAATAAKPAPRGASTSAILNASETGWYAGIRDLPVGPLTRKELIAKVQSAEVTPDTLVWREGLDDWRPLRNVAELGDVLRLGAQRISGNLLDEMGRRPPAAAAPAAPERRSGQVVPLRQPVPSAPAMTRPAMTDDDEEATRVTGMDPAIAALIPRTLGPQAKAPAAPAKPAAEDEPDLTLTETPNPAAAAKAPSSFAKPAPRVPPPAAPKAPPAKAPAPPRATLAGGFGPQARAPAPPAPTPPPPAAAKVSSIPPPPAAEPEPEPESLLSLTIDSVVMPSPLLGAEPQALKPSSIPPASSISAAGEDELPADLFGKKPFPPQSNAPSLESFGLGAAFQSAPPPSASSAPAAFGAMPGHSPTTPGYAPPASLQPPPRPAGLSMPVIILMAGVLVVGVFGGVLLAGRLNRPIPQPIPAPVPVAVPQPAAPAPAVAAPAPTPEPATPAVAAAEPPDNEPATPGHPRRPHTGRAPAAAPAAPALTAQQRADLARLMGPGGGPVTPPPGTLRNPSAANSGDPSPAPTGAARAGRAVRAFQDSRVANNCWQNLLRQNPAIRDTRVTITLTVNALGRISGTSVSPSPDPRFDACINSGASRVAPIGAGESVGAQVAFNFTTGG